jgi:hypothetical protein
VANCKFDFSHLQIAESYTNLLKHILVHTKGVHNSAAVGRLCEHLKREATFMLDMTIKEQTLSTSADYKAPDHLDTNDAKWLSFYRLQSSHRRMAVVRHTFDVLAELHNSKAIKVVFFCDFTKQNKKLFSSDNRRQ